MSLKNKNKKNGEIIYMVLVGTVYLSALFTLYGFNGKTGFGILFLAIAGVITGFSGLALWGWGFFTLGKYFYILPKPLGYTNKGAYKFIPHPIYTGISLTFIGFSLAKGSIIPLVYSLLVLTPFNIFRAKLENRYLKVRTLTSNPLRKSKPRY